MTYMCLIPGVLGGVSQTLVETYDECPTGSYIAQSLDAYTPAPTLVDIFTIPIASDLQQMWMTGFALPVICYLTAWGFQTVIAWFEK